MYKKKNGKLDYEIKFRLFKSKKKILYCSL